MPRPTDPPITLKKCIAPRRQLSEEQVFTDISPDFIRRLQNHIKPH